MLDNKIDRQLAINYVLIDLENVQPNNLEILVNHPFRILVFVGANQAKGSYEMAISIQKFGKNAQYIKISAIGPNALDFHIAFYIGELSMQEPNAYFHIISKDKGYDPLIKHLRERNIQIQRKINLTEISVFKKYNSSINNNEKIMLILKRLSNQKVKPKTINSLSNSIDSFFGKKLHKEEVILLVNELQRRKYITVEQNNISYICYINKKSCV